LSQGAVSGYFAPEIVDLVEKGSEGGPLAVVAIDIPIGLPDAGRRQTDLLARKAVGQRWASVFMTPVRPALEASDYESASAASLKLAGEAISRQAFALHAKILQVDQWVRQARHRVVEVHPEVSFVQLAAGPLPAPKSTWVGVARRRKLLARVGMALPDDLGPAGGKVAVDDVQDAAVAAWTAVRVLRNQARRYPDLPEVFSDGLASAICALGRIRRVARSIPTLRAERTQPHPSCRLRAAQSRCCPLEDMAQLCQFCAVLTSARSC
jgi:predicted RNase H-like nuclease